MEFVPGENEMGVAREGDMVTYTLFFIPYNASYAIFNYEYRFESAS